jgi:hypothetical protein
VDDDSRVQRERAERERYRRGLPDHHDPTAGIGGAPPAYSALTLRLVLAGFGLLFCTISAVWLYVVDGPLLVVLLLLLLAVVAVVDLVVIIRRKRRGEPG